MKESFWEKFAVGAIATVIVVICVGAIYALTWGVTCGVLYLVTLCFGVEFNLLYATGVWLIILLLKWIISSARNTSSRK